MSHLQRRQIVCGDIQLCERCGSRGSFDAQGSPRHSCILREGAYWTCYYPHLGGESLLLLVLVIVSAGIIHKLVSPWFNLMKRPIRRSRRNFVRWPRLAHNSTQISLVKQRYFHVGMLAHFFLALLHGCADICCDPPELQRSFDAKDRSIG